MIRKSVTLLLAVPIALAVALPQVAAAVESAAEKRAEAPLAGLSAPKGCTLVGESVPPRLDLPRATSAFLPTQLEVRTPFEPTVFPSAGRNYLVYELHLRNFASESLELQGIEVIDGSGTGQLLAAFGAEQLASLIFPRSHGLSAEEIAQSRQLASGHGTVAYLCLAFEPDVTVPTILRHRVLLTDDIADGPSIGTRHTALRVLAPPVAGPDWIAAGGPGNTGHHRVGLLVMHGNARISRRYAIDWKKMRDESTFAGDPIHLQSYHAYGEPVYAVEDGTVVAARDGLPDNLPRTPKGFETALPVTMKTIAGNAVTLDLGGGHFALYAHLAPESVLVKEGDRVRRGQALGRIGNSGDSREPHLHFEISDSPKLLAGEGLPYLIDRYEIRLSDGSMDARANELPTLEMRVSFRPGQSTSD